MEYSGHFPRAQVVMLLHMTSLSPPGSGSVLAQPFMVRRPLLVRCVVTIAELLEWGTLPDLVTEA